MSKLVFGVLAVAAFSSAQASASVCIVSTGWQTVYCDGKKVSTFDTSKGEEYAVITGVLKKLQDEGYKISSESATSEREEYTLTK